MKEYSEKVKRSGAIAWMAGNSVASNIFMAILILGGIVMFTQIKQEVFPAFDLDIVNVSVSYPGASPEEVESGIILSIEEAIQNVDGIDEIRSTASEGFGSVTVEAMEGIDLGKLSREIESEVNSISSFPEEAESPSVSVASRRREVISFALHGNQKETVLREKAEELRDELLADPAITQVTLSGIRDYEIQIEISMENLRRYGLTIQEVAARIRKTSVDLPGGSLETSGGEILVRMKERRELAVEYAALPVFTEEDGSRVLLRDIATIKDGFSDSSRSAAFNGEKAIRLQVYRVEDQKPIEIAEAVKKKMAEFNKSLPDGLHLSMVRDMSELFRQRGELLTRNACIGLLLVFCCLALFLEFRLAFWVSMGIPASILGSFLILPLAGFSINIVTMFAFIVTLGIVVDDAIVVGENIFYNRQNGMPYLQAAIQGAKEIAMPVTFSILTNIVAFIPLFFVPGHMGKIFKMIPAVVIAVLLISLVESLFVLPAHLGHQKQREPGKERRGLSRYQNRFSLAFTSFVENIYGTFLTIVLRNRYIALSIGVAILIGTAGYVKSGRMGMTLFPRVESDYSYVTVTLPYGAPDESVLEIQKVVVDAAKKIVEDNGGETLSRGIYSRINENVITARLLLTPPTVRPIGTQEVTVKWREQVGQPSGIESITFQSDRGGPGSGKGLTIELSHRDSDILTKASEELAAEIETYPNASDIDDGSASGKLQYDFKMLPEGERLGFTASDVARTVRSSLYGSEVHRIQRKRNEVKVMVRLPKEERETDHTLDQLVIKSSAGAEVPLYEIVSKTSGRAYTSIERRKGKRISSVTANIIPRAKANMVIDGLKESFIPELLEKFPGLTYSLEGRQADIKESISSLFKGLLMSLLVIYCLLSIPLKSYFQPLLIMSCIPFGLVGAVYGHLILGYSLSIMSLFGLVALTGVVINDSLVLIDFANRKRSTGLDPYKAVIGAGIHRFRPILLTTLTTFGGLSPMIFETSRQARFLIPMAISLGFGILFATLITLVLVPVFYLILEDFIWFFSLVREGVVQRFKRMMKDEQYNVE